MTTLVLHPAPTSYSLKGRCVLELCAGPSGSSSSASCLVAALSTRCASSQQEPQTEVSVWHTLAGLTRMCTSVLRIPSTSFAAPAASPSALLWHSSGRQLAALSAGSVFFLSLSAPDLTGLDIETADLRAASSRRGKLQCVRALALEAVSLAPDDGDLRAVWVGAAQCCYRVSWSGETLQEVRPPAALGKELWRPWIAQGFALDSTSSPAPDTAITSSTSSFSATPPPSSFACDVAAAGLLVLRGGAGSLVLCMQGRFSPHILVVSRLVITAAAVTSNTGGGGARGAEARDVREVANAVARCLLVDGAASPRLLFVLTNERCSSLLLLQAATVTPAPAIPTTPAVTLRRLAFRHLGSSSGAAPTSAVALVPSLCGNEPLVCCRDPDPACILCLRLDLASVVFRIALPGGCPTPSPTLCALPGALLVASPSSTSPPIATSTMYLCTWMHTLASPLQPHGSRLLLDACQGALLVHRTGDSKLTPRLLGGADSDNDADNEAAAEEGPEGGDEGGSLHSYGGFAGVPLPFAARAAGRRAGGLLVAASRDCKHAEGHAANPGYVAVVAGGGQGHEQEQECLWLYSLRTGRWRTAALGEGQLVAPGLAGGRRGAKGALGPVPAAPPTSLPVVLSASWLGEGLLALLTRRRCGPAVSCFLLELLSREASRESLLSGKPCPLVHASLFLPLSFAPCAVDVMWGLPGGAGAVLVGDGARLLCFRVSPAAGGAGVGVALLWDLSCGPGPAVSRSALLHDGSADVANPASLSAAVLLASGEGLLLDVLPAAEGGGWTQRRRAAHKAAGEAADGLGAFCELRTVPLAALFGAACKGWGALFLPRAGEGCLLLPLRLRGGAAGWAVPALGLGGGGDFGLAGGVRLSIRQRLPPLALACSGSGSGSSSSRAGERALLSALLEPGGAACVTPDPLAFSALVFLAARVGGGVDLTDASAAAADGDAAGAGWTPVAAARLLLAHAAGSPHTLALLCEHLETALRALVGDGGGGGGGAGAGWGVGAWLGGAGARAGLAGRSRQEMARAYACLLHCLHHASPLLCAELLSGLGRKLEPSAAASLLPPLPLPTTLVPGSTAAHTPPPLRSLLLLFQHCLAGGNLRGAGRLLVLACDGAGGTESADSTLRCLGLALELAQRCLAAPSPALPLAADALQFASRLEDTLGLIAGGGGAGSASGSGGGSGSGGSSGSGAGGGGRGRVAASRGLLGSLLATLAAVSPSLSYLLSLPLAAIGAVNPFAFAPNRLLGAGTAAGAGAAGAGSRPSALARVQEMLGLRAAEIVRGGAGAHSAASFTSALAELALAKLVREGRMGALCAVSAALLSSREGRESAAGALTGGGFTRGAPDDGRGIGAGTAVAAAVVAVLRLGALGMSTAALARKLGQPTPSSLFRQLTRRDPCPPSGPAAPLLDMPASCAQGSLRQVLAAAVLALLLCRGNDEHDDAGGSAGGGNASAAACLMLVLGLPSLSALTLCVCAAERSGGPEAQADTRALREYVAAQLIACLEGAAAGVEGAGHPPSLRASPGKAVASGPLPGEHLPLPGSVLMQLRALLLPLLGRDVSVSECVGAWAAAAGRATEEAGPAVAAMAAAAAEREARRSRGALATAAVRAKGPKASFVV